MCQTTSAATATGHLARHRIYNDIDAETGVVFTLESLVPPVVIPFAAVILVRVEHAEPAFVLDATQIIVHEVVAPSVQFVRGLRWPLGKLEKRSVDRMR